MSIGIRSVTAQVPDTVIGREAFEYLLPLCGDLSMLPAERRRDEREDAAERLSLGAGRGALEAAALEPGEVDLLIVSVIGGRYILPGLATQLHQQLGLRPEVPAWNVQQVCASLTDAVYMASALMRAEPDRYRQCLVVAATAWWCGEWGVDATSLAAGLVGDGGCGVVLGRDGLKADILAYENRTHGEIFPYLVMDHRQPENPHISAPSAPQNNCAIMVQSPDFMPWMERTGVHLSSELIPPALEKTGWSADDLDLVIPHQVMKFAVDAWAHSLEASHGVAASRWIDSWDRYGNVAAVDAWITLADLSAQGALAAGTRLSVFTPAGAGHNSTLMLRWH